METPGAPRIGRIEVRYTDWRTGKLSRVGVSITKCLEQELGLHEANAQFWGREVQNALIGVYLSRTDFWYHIDVKSREIWNMEQSVRRILRIKNQDGQNVVQPARFFVNKDSYLCLVKAVKARGAAFDRKFSYIYKYWFPQYHGYVQQPAFAVISQTMVPTEDSMWLVTTQLYPRIFYEELDTGKQWRKGGIKFEQLVYVEDQWCREMSKSEEAKTFEIAWHEVPIPIESAGEAPAEMPQEISANEEPVQDETIQTEQTAN